MTTKAHLPHDLFPVTGRRGKRARILPNQAITDANAVNSPLLRLPPEIRQMILRMVVGDKLIHLYSLFCDSSAKSDSRVGHGLQRSLCVIEAARPCTSGPSHATTDRRSSAKEVESSFVHAHEDCSNPDRHGEFEYKSFSRIFSTSRLISQEAPCIFWGTNQFCFEDAAALKRFLSILRRLNTKNKLKHLVIEYSIGAGKSTEWAQIGSQSTLSALRGLETLEFHVQFSGWVRAEPRATIIDDCLEPFDNLRLLNLKKVLVSISYDRIVSKNCFERHELQATAETFRQRLLDPVITPQEYLADSIRKLKRSLRNTEESVKDHTNQMQDLQQKVDAGRFKAERAKVEINELQAMVQRNDTAEIEKVLQTDQGGVFSEEE